MILMRQRRAKEGHNAVAHHLIHRAFVVVHGLHHASEYRVKELPGCLGIAVGKQLHRAFQVGKENRHLLALAFEGAARREDLLLQVRWSIGCRRALGVGWRGRQRRRARVRGESDAAFATEQALRRERGATRRTDVLQLAATAQTKAKINGIVMVAAGTTHPFPLPEDVVGLSVSRVPRRFNTSGAQPDVALGKNA